MKRFMILMAVVVLIVSLVLLADQLFTPQPVQIVLETGQEITAQSLEYFPLTKVLLLLVSSFFIGMTSTYLFYNTDTKEVLHSFQKPRVTERNYDTIFPLLKAQEKKVLMELAHAKGELLQSRLVASIGLSKVKVSRIVSRLERKGLVVKERYGLTNKIKLK